MNKYQRPLNEIDYDKMVDNIWGLGNVADVDSYYCSAILRIRDVIRENNQEVKYSDSDNCYGIYYAWCVGEFSVKSNISRFNVGQIVVKDKDFAQWLIDNYETDLRIILNS